MAPYHYGGGGFGSFGGQGYSYSTLTSSGDKKNNGRRRRGSYGAPACRRDPEMCEKHAKPRRKSDSPCDKHAAQMRHRARARNYASLPSGLTMPRIPILCDQKCQYDVRNEHPVAARPAPHSSNRHHHTAGSPRHGEKGGSPTLQVPRTAVDKGHRKLSTDKARTSTDRTTPERRQVYRKSHESSRSGRSHLSKTQNASHVSRPISHPPSHPPSRPASIAPPKVPKAQKAPPRAPARAKTKKEGSLWGCFRG
ncbi:hypothetical protein B0T10DRAFT_43367 [Thelonectria olida]|uniref:Uncharacterized protein n=1 Tax=Thelonectria olida TaxID=1576542 RepID=A0A9P9AQ72_9HYPO|nr:hypothetical protein B0T10DRAFT_43367 [Thelonectria olida]